MGNKMLIHELELLALLENLRLRSPNDDEPIRICSAIVAMACGYKSRADWIDELKKAELVYYSHDREEEKEKAEVQYRQLFEKLDEELKEYYKTWEE